MRGAAVAASPQLRFILGQLYPRLSLAFTIINWRILVAHLAKGTIGEHLRLVAGLAWGQLAARLLRKAREWVCRRLTIEISMQNELFAAFSDPADAWLLAEAIVDTVHEPLLVLDSDLQVIVASRSFYLKFDTTRDVTQGRRIYDLENGVWNLPELRLLLEKIVPEHGVMEGFEVEREFPRLGYRSMLLNARQVFYAGGVHTTILLGIEDVTERRKIERAVQNLLEQKEMLLQEMSHRVANSLQIIASILLMKAKTVNSPETRVHLQDAHRRVMSIASVQQHLQASGKGEQIAVRPYLSKLCESLAASMIGDNRAISLKVVAGEGTSTSGEAVSIGLIVTELVINSLKHAFSDSSRPGQQVIVGYEADGKNWKLSTSDNGVGMPDRRAAPTRRVSAQA